MTSPAPAILWFRQDLRLADNPALAAAAASGRAVIPLYVLDETARPLGGASRWWLERSLAALDADLRARGSRLVFRRGDPRLQIGELVATTGAEAVFWNRLYDGHSVARDSELKSDLKADGVEAISCNGGLLVEPWTVKTGAGDPYRVFTPYWRAAQSKIEPLPALDAETQISAPNHWPDSDNLSDWKLYERRPDWAKGFNDWTPGEAGARAALARFLDEPAATYAEDRDRPDRVGTSRLSPHLHFGEIGPRQVWRALRGRDLPAGQADKFLAEIGWREFNHHLLFHWPDLPIRNFKSEFDRFEWRDDEPGFRAWARGLTGYPIVDAGMRELWATGWMHNRVRMIVASFLIKDLMIDWRRGEAWFWDTLVDADIAQNAGNWQWVAGSGADASPWFRIFNPVTQGQKFDPDGDYVRKWIPELAGLSSKTVHAPWIASDSELQSAGVRLGETYPRPVVDHAEARERALDAYVPVRNG
ncbi:cryptochrome/photolyase family protein [Caulobacter mirabilis]|uniref:Deoxyribodipyrimidine photo-lyase n=1 Tax=Caulobacter mirabilis TaxID=69666 RepID=A0A2D2AXX1_9CAUL|nr:deoxyribodipyrimidine photo-lyase [Caulobacter mirabilis]ATQ42823.1 deoxyribodipyrimidine photolyase [Caulobacter mirabilis]